MTRVAVGRAAPPAAAATPNSSGATAPPVHRRTLPPAAVLLDRDGTLVEDVPYNGDPALVQARPGAQRALARLRRAGIPLALEPDEVVAALRRLPPSPAVTVTPG